ncbi:sulfite exporter TauE/SafE family protein [Kaarinaea lacus]
MSVYEILALYCLLGAFAGIVAGLLGVGGGLIIVPVLIAIWQSSGFESSYQMQLAIGTSLATIVLTSISSVRAHHGRGSVRWDIFWSLTPGIVIGTWMGAYIATRLPGDVLRNIFGIFELLIAAQMAFSVRPEAQRTLPGIAGMSTAGTVIGSVSAVIGIGGVTITVPFLTWCNVVIHRAVGTSAACGLPIALGGVLGYLLLGWNNPELPEWSAGFIYLPALIGIVVTSILFAPLGARLAHSLSVPVLRRVFAGFLALLGVWMLAS